MPSKKNPSHIVASAPGSKTVHAHALGASITPPHRRKAKRVTRETGLQALRGSLNGSVWASLTTEPTTGVTLCGTDGTILYINAQSCRIYFGETQTPKSVTGRPWQSLFPKEFVQDRQLFLDTVARDNKPMLVRGIWKGYQYRSWAYPVHAEGDPETVDRILIITRRMPSDPEIEAQLCMDRALEEQVARFIDLGPLNVLTRRELEVVALIGRGLSTKEIALTLGCTAKTIENHRNAVGNKLGVKDRHELAAMAIRAGLTLKDAEREKLN